MSRLVERVAGGTSAGHRRVARQAAAVVAITAEAERVAVPAVGPGAREAFKAQ
jgi:hypothetical protein